MHRTLLTILTLTGTTLALVGCLPDTPAPSPPAPTSSAPLFATDEEALAAAEEVYREYLAATDGSPDLDRLAAIATADWLDYERESVDLANEKGLHSVGNTELVSLSIRQRDSDRFEAYACVDVSAVRVLDSSGADVTPASRPQQPQLLVSFVTRDNGLLIDGSQLWSNSCS